MFKYIIVWLSMFSVAYSQPPNHINEVNAIALSDQFSHTRIMTPTAYTSTSASNNFDIKYYRCEWEVDPAIRYIRGIITIYYTITSATTNISLDLMNTL